MSERVVITGIGVLAPGGTGTGPFWDLLSEGRTATRLISAFDPAPFRSRTAAEIDFDPAAAGLSSRQVRRMDRAAQLALVAAGEAVADSGLDLDALDPGRLGVTLGTAVGATTGLEAEYRVVSDEGRLFEVDHEHAVRHLHNFLVPSSFAAELAVEFGAEGPVAVVSTGCTSGLDAVAHAAGLIREGSAEVVIAGATDAPISPITVACFDALKATTPRNDDPAHASRPFDATRNGFVLGEGSAVFVLESLAHARKRGAVVHAEFAGYGTRCNAFHMTGLRPDGTEMTGAIEAALAEARIGAEEVDYVNAHGSGTRQNDRHETAAFKRALGEHAHRIPVSSIKSMIGHSLGAIGALEIAASVLAIRHDLVPPTANLHEPDPECDLDYVPLTARPWRTDTVLSVGSGFGGFQSAVVLRQVAA
ncbi:beta-ketoacyl-[acyl-carrier-protein] synthase family protein [Amycolatopsis magusensis]|uniref:Act minimal PKS ketosynthase (KS/KS alpha) n=1 Tax=Amycolatopsis magusensis TaxID=882444 RepID=A0ABS4PYM8_9PSEU|nr:beta-ketoacyl-[acyl-carrier-protein] synthase family protein [Amycolatopsis magusensis]MBP2184536.1 act minimal PKS ketosynthase (KS/KS alpha) [Amycolatopsis magusensis]